MDQAIQWKVGTGEENTVDSNTHKDQNKVAEFFCSKSNYFFWKAIRDRLRV